IRNNFVVTLAIVILPFGAGSTAVRAGVAQLVEHLICNQTVGGSSPFASSRVWPGVPRRNHSKLTSGFPLAARESVCGTGWCGKALRGILLGSGREPFYPSL